MDLSCFVWTTCVSSFKSCSTFLFWRKDQHAQLDALKNLPIRSLEVPRITLHQWCWQRCQRLLSQHRIMITEESSQLGDVCMFVCKDEKMWVFNCDQQLPPQQLLDHSCSKQLLWFPITSHQRNCQEFAPCASHRSVLQTHLHKRWDLLTGWQGFFSAVCAMVISSVCYSHTGHHDFLNKILRVKSWRKQLGKAMNFSKNCRYPSCLCKKLARSFSLFCILKARGNLHASFPNTPTLSQQERPLWNGFKRL